MKVVEATRKGLAQLAKGEPHEASVRSAEVLVQDERGWFWLVTFTRESAQHPWEYQRMRYA